MSLEKGRFGVTTATPYKTAILKAYGEEVTPPKTGKPGRPRGPHHVPPPELNYATVHKTREKGRVVKVDFRVIFGTVAAVTAALASSLLSLAQLMSGGLPTEARIFRPRPESPDH